MKQKKKPHILNTHPRYQLTNLYGPFPDSALVSGDANQIPSYVTTIPDGSETGVYLAVDLGGTNCRVCSVDLHGDSTYTLRQVKHVVPPEFTVNQSHKPLFLFIAQKLADFLEQYHPETGTAAGSGTGTASTGSDETLQGHDAAVVNSGSLKEEEQADGAMWRKLGFTFSFTCDQTSLASGTLIHWDKGWSIPEALGKDPCAMLQWAIDELSLPVVVSALANDSVGSLLARSYVSGGNGDGTTSTLASAIFGTGTNAAYVEQMANVTKLHKPGGGQGASSYTVNDVTAINTEWGCFDEELNVLPSTRFDEELDKASPQPGEGMMEKRVGGLYLGELFRLAVVELGNTCRFDMAVPEDSPLYIAESLDASLLSCLAGDSTMGLSAATAGVAEALRATNVSRNDVQAMRLVSMAIVRRAARISGASLAAIIIRSGRLAERDDGMNQEMGKQACAVEERQLDSSLSSGHAGEGNHRTGLLFSIRAFVSKLLSLLGHGSTSQPSPSATTTTSFSAPTSTSTPTARPSTTPASAPAPATASLLPTVDIGVDGSIIEFYPGFEADMRAALRDVPQIGPAGEARLTIGLAKDGSSVGAALMALAAERQMVGDEMR
jgi:hexokinase